MSIETEIKAHVNDDILEDVKAKLCNLTFCETLGEISKFDVYWALTEDGDPMFRTRKELDSGKPRVLFTAKPHKEKNSRGTENNEELEFETPYNQWDSILTFLSGIGFQVCRLKWKKGWHYNIEHNGFHIHAELLNVKYLGWFLEMEICSNKEDNLDVKEEDRALRDILSFVGISEDCVEGTGYNKMLKAIGHDKG